MVDQKYAHDLDTLRRLEGTYPQVTEHVEKTKDRDLKRFRSGVLPGPGDVSAPMNYPGLFRVRVHGQITNGSLDRFVVLYDSWTQAVQYCIGWDQEKARKIALTAMRRELEKSGIKWEDFTALHKPYGMFQA